LKLLQKLNDPLLTFLSSSLPESLTIIRSLPVSPEEPIHCQRHPKGVKTLKKEENQPFFLGQTRRVVSKRYQKEGTMTKPNELLPTITPCNPRLSPTLSIFLGQRPGGKEENPSETTPGSQEVSACLPQNKAFVLFKQATPHLFCEINHYAFPQTLVISTFIWK